MLFALLAAVLTARAERPVWNEEALEEATEASIDILPWHHYVLRTQQLIDKPGNFAELSFYGAPARYELPNGVTRDGSLIRFGVGAGFGAGKPATGFAAFAGMLADYALAQGSSPISSEETLGMAADAVIYGGFAYKGWTATAAALPHGTFAFIEEVGGRGSGLGSGISSAYTLYNQEGVAVGAVRGSDRAGRALISAIRGELRPERLLERTELRRFGVFAAGVNRFAPGLDIYQAHPPDADIPATWEIPLAAEDLGESGFRVAVVPEIAPRLSLRRAQVGYLFDRERAVAGAQAGVVSRGGSLQPTIQVYGAFHPEWFRYFSVYGVPRIALSYSYNVPDPVSFFPVERAHVLGVQYIYGREEFARPLLPIYRSSEELAEIGG